MQESLQRVVLDTYAVLALRHQLQVRTEQLSTEDYKLRMEQKQLYLEYEQLAKPLDDKLAAE